MGKQSKRLHKFGWWFAAKRKDAGLTQKALAEAVDVDRSYIAQIENETRWPTKPRLFAIFAALGVPIGEGVKALNLKENDEAERILRFQEFVEEVGQNMDPTTAKRFADMFASDQEQYRWVGQFALAEPLPPAPEGWIRLNKEDRRLVQRVVNRLLDSYREEEAEDADQA